MKLTNPFKSTIVTDYVVTGATANTFKLGPALFDGFTADDWTDDLAIKLPQEILKASGENIKFFCGKLKSNYFTGNNAALVENDCKKFLKSPAL